MKKSSVDSSVPKLKKPKRQLLYKTPQIILAGSYQESDWRNAFLLNYSSYTVKMEDKLTIFGNCKFLGFYPQQKLIDYYNNIKKATFVVIYIADINTVNDKQLLDTCAVAYQHNIPILLIYATQEILLETMNHQLHAFTKQIFCLESSKSALYAGSTPKDVVYAYLYWYGFFCQSPLEKSFWKKLQTLKIQGWQLQYPIQVNGHAYNVDFAHPLYKIVIEVDGYAYHSRNREDFVKERERWRLIQSQGWKIIPFAGSEIKFSVQKCLDFILQEIQTINTT